MSETEAAGGAGPLKDAILIAGPTASGKSQAALALARRFEAAIVNADSMQVYAQLSILTARPPGAALEAAPHHLYGHVDPASPYSTGAWLEDVRRLVSEGRLAGRRPIFAGGTGLYFRALTQGLAAMPAIDAGIRARWRGALAQEGAARLHERLLRLDPAAAAAIRPSDGQRIVRALEVMEASGRSILSWQAGRPEPLVDMATAQCVVLEIDRDALAARISERFDAMIAAGAVAEVEALAARGLDPGMPAMKAIGVPQLAAHLAGDTDLETAIARAKTATRRYAKRQATWFRHQMGEEWRRAAAGAEVYDLIR